MSNTTTKQQLSATLVEDRRAPSNRRLRFTGAFTQHSHRGKRQLARRSGDQYRNQRVQKGYYIDKYEPKMLVITLSILLLCLADAYMTILIIANGGEELNIFMDTLINKGMFNFIIGKYIITSGCLIFLLAHRNFHVFGNIEVSQILSSLLVIYILLIGYEISIIESAKLIPLPL